MLKFTTMKLKELGRNFLKVEITQISTHGIWLLVNGVEYFLSFKDFPWFENATVAQIHHVQLLHGFHLRWPEIDVDLHMESLNNLEKYSLVSK